MRHLAWPSRSPFPSRLIRFSISLLLAPLAARAASFSFSLSTPIQCSNMTVSVSGGVPPYQLVIIPYGNINPETRKIISLNLTAGQTTQSFFLAYPTGSQFVALMNDATGVGTGGTGVPTTVSASNDDSCLTKTGNPDFVFYMNPNYTTQCQTTVLGWDTSPPTAAEGAVTFYGIIPGGQTFLLSPPSQPYNWNVSVRAGTSVTLFAGDSRGIGTGGSAGPFIVNGTDTSCINDHSPSSTAGSPAGAVTGSVESSTSSSAAVVTSVFTSGSQIVTTTSSSTAISGSSGKSSSNVGAIVGGVVGGVVAVTLISALLIFWWLRRTRRTRALAAASRRGTIDLTGDDADSGTPPSQSGGPPMIEAGFYHPEPFVVPELSSSQPSTDLNHDSGGAYRPSSDLTYDAYGGAAGAASSAAELRERRESQHTLGSNSGAGTGTATASQRVRGKQHPPSAMRATNFVQHEDAGILGSSGGGADPEQDTEELVELPPAYTSVRHKGSRGRVRSTTPSPPAVEP